MPPFRSNSSIPSSGNSPSALLKTVSPIRHRMSRHTRDLLRQYYKKGLLNTPIPDRDVVDLPVQLSPPERALYEAVEDYISDTYEAAAKRTRRRPWGS